jgi:hypothetical protein
LIIDNIKRIKNDPGKLCENYIYFILNNFMEIFIILIKFNKWIILIINYFKLDFRNINLKYNQKSKKYFLSKILSFSIKSKLLINITSKQVIKFKNW